MPRSQVLQAKGTPRELREGAFGVSLPLGQENLSAAEADRADGADAPSALWAGQSVTRETAAWLRRWLDEQPDRVGCQPSSGCEAPGQGRRLSIALRCVSSCTHHKAKKTCWVRTSSQMRYRLAGADRQNAIPIRATRAFPPGDRGTL
jgi:hypothetical protein